MIEQIAIYAFLAGLVIFALVGGFLIITGLSAWHEADLENARKWNELLAWQEAEIEAGCRKLGITREQLEARTERRRRQA